MLSLYMMTKAAPRISFAQRPALPMSRGTIATAPNPSTVNTLVQQKTPCLRTIDPKPPGGYTANRIVCGSIAAQE